MHNYVVTRAKDVGSINLLRKFSTISLRAIPVRVQSLEV